LVGFRDSCFDVGVVHKGEFLISTQLVLKASRFFFQFVGVYGPADHSRSPLFLQELEEVVSRATSPVFVAGDFNLIRGRNDKNNRNIDWPRVNMFNDSIARLQLREVVRSGARFTWTNKQLNPVRSVLDRVLISPQWEITFPLLSLVAESSIGSDHTPLVLPLG
jgi:endonuclease/exonuclease/phosphatase family metal-dependent hydrolase